MNLQTEHLQRCILTLESSVSMLGQSPSGSTEYEVFRNAVVKGFELVLELSGKLLRRALREYEGNIRKVDDLYFKDVLRHAAKYGLLDTAAVSRWFTYRDNRNSTAHDYGVAFAQETLGLLPGFIADAKALESCLREKFGGVDAWPDP